MMPIQLRDMGAYIRADSRGYLSSAAGIDKVSDKWRLAVDGFVALVCEKYPENTHSIYLRGSVATGAAIDGVSDIDFFVITNRHAGRDDRERIWRDAGILGCSYPFIAMFDIGFFTVEEALMNKERALIKLTSVCIHGDSVISRIPDLRPGRDVAVTLPGLEREMRETQEKIDSGLKEAQAICRWMMKRLVRAGFELVSEREAAFTRDLYKCWASFSKHYPRRSSEMLAALNMAIEPHGDTSDIARMMDSLGTWLIGEAREQGIIEEDHRL